MLIILLNRKYYEEANDESVYFTVKNVLNYQKYDIISMLLKGDDLRNSSRSNYL